MHRTSQAMADAPRDDPVQAELLGLPAGALAPDGGERGADCGGSGRVWRLRGVYNLALYGAPVPRYYEFEVTLQEIEPRIWRRFLLRTTTSFAHLHDAIQDAFGWEDYHLWEFRLPRPIGRVLAGCPSQDGDDGGRPPPDGRAVKLNTYFTGESRLEWCEYEYDFGDSWIHDVKLVGVHSLPEAFKRRLLDGARACPREDSGGVGGYDRCVHFVSTGEDVWDEPEVIGLWIGDWDPEAFDCELARARFDR